MRDGETFADRVRRLRLELKMSQAGLAKESGLSPGTIGDIESGRQKGTKNIDRLVEALKTTSDYLRHGIQGSSTQRKIPELSLSAREAQLLDRFRNFSEKNKQRIEDFAAGMQVSNKKAIRSISQTADEIHATKSRRSG